MTAILAIITSFFIFVVVYLTITAVLCVTSWWLKRRGAGESAMQSIEEIEHRMDHIKDKVFVIALILTFFVITPFVIIVWVMP